MTPTEVREELLALDKGMAYRDSRLYGFGQWWWNKYLSDEERSDRAGISPFTSAWVDLSRLPDEELMFLWAVYLM